MEIKYIAIFVVAVLSILRLKLARQSATFKEKNKGEIANSWTYSMLLMLYIVILLSSIIENYVSVQTLNLIVFVIGLCLYIIGTLGRNIAIKTLGQYWSIHIEIRKKQSIVQDGPYKYIRHPGYLSLIIETLSLPIMLNAYYSLLIVICLYIPAVLIRANLEDSEMEKKIGKEYSHYKEKVKAFIPKIFLFF
ncbi:MAG: isoprenylcysteine carboxylmethyltransferase family protein [Deltaproteobacteria bacterium]|nr:isoprenylcysteine carboxylmethyltransferase family protein [Deltaproteobacteria bacterium]